MTSKTLFVYQTKNSKGNYVKRYSVAENASLGELTPIKAYRLSSEKNKVLTDGTLQLNVVDTENPELWSEIDVPQESINETKSE